MKTVTLNDLHNVATLFLGEHNARSIPAFRVTPSRIRSLTCSTNIEHSFHLHLSEVASAHTFPMESSTDRLDVFKSVFSSLSTEERAKYLASLPYDKKCALLDITFP